MGEEDRDARWKKTIRYDRFMSHRDMRCFSALFLKPKDILLSMITLLSASVSVLMAKRTSCPIIWSFTDRTIRHSSFHLGLLLSSVL